MQAAIDARKPDFAAYVEPQKQKADIIVQVLLSDLVDDPTGKFLKVPTGWLHVDCLTPRISMRFMVFVVFNSILCSPSDSSRWRHGVMRGLMMTLIPKFVCIRFYIDTGQRGCDAMQQRALRGRHVHSTFLLNPYHCS